MTGHLTQQPQTPAALARAILDAIRAQPDAFDMEEWTNLAPGEELEPGAITCGTTLCAAGWAAHLTGWTIVSTPLSVYAEKDERTCNIGDAACEALGLTEDETFWWEDEETAIHRLEEIAGLR
ncbi:hypothetical protein [Streptomyces sp. DH37]|uniref:hypothetical protein n=1 Tax=Streptomyces sp. DH37 TaxID=3040122 RepID=UPI0024430B7C|nr:hypothetical protein [Streptomyces sp. DH37]MDG9703800.1 hypothetical protein [Streptomyces sp. DH37]